MLPSVFVLVHPLGTVLGRAKYDDYLIVYQKCSIGSNHNIYPKLGQYLTLRPGAGIYGDSTVENNVSVAAESYIIDKDIQTNKCYIGTPNAFVLKPQAEVNKIWRI